MSSGANWWPFVRALLRAWLLNMKDKITDVGTTLALDPSVVTAVQATCTAHMAKIDDVVAKQAALDAAYQAEKESLATTEAALRELIGQWKKMSNWTDEIAATLQVIKAATTQSLTEYKPTFKVRIVAGEIRLDWLKHKADGVAVYSRLAGTLVWIKLATDNNSPYIDGRPLANPAVPETREYMLRGLVKDEEIGLDSDILSITWAGH